MAWLLDQPDVRYVLNVTGSSPRVGTNQARSQMTVIMKPWDEREDPDLPAFMARVTDEFSQYPESKVYLSTPPVIPGLGTSGGSMSSRSTPRARSTSAPLPSSPDWVPRAVSRWPSKPAAT